MEEVTQSFCLAGEAGIIDILCDNVNGQNVVRWIDIEQIFPGVKYVKRGNIAVTFMKDPQLTKCIKHYPGVVLDVVLSTSDGNEPTTVSRTNNSTNATLRQQSPPSDDGDDTNSTFLSNQIVKHVQKDDLESGVEQLLVTSPPSDSQSKVLASSRPDALVRAIKGGHLNRLGEQMIVRLQDLKDEVAKNNELASKINDLVLENNQVGYRNKELLLENNQVAHENKELLIRLNDLQNVLDSKQDEMKELQIQALDRLALIQNNVKALLMQTYELHEYPIPRLFIVLPDEKSSWNPMDFFSNKFRLYFLCECGEHTKATNSKIPHHIHLAKHEGYDIDRPNEFFQQYGSYVLTILRMLKFGISVAGVAIPVLSQLIRVDGHDQATASLKLLEKTIEPGMDQVIKHIDKASADGSGAVVGFSEQMENNEALEGADLRQLESFLKIKDLNRVLGNLYRIVTGEGHVKWVCLDHFRENYHAKAAQAFRETVNTLQGTFDENIGRAEVRLKSRLQAEQFYRVLESAKSVYELKVVLDWDTTQSDFKMLRNILPKTSVGVLELYLSRHDVRTRDLLGRSQPFDPILDIVQLRSIQSFTIRGPCDLTKRSNLLSRKYEFPNLRRLDISLDQLKEDTLAVKFLITKSSNLSSLTLGSSASFAQVSLGETAVGSIIPSTLRHLDIPLYQLKYDIPGVVRLITNAACLSRLDSLDLRIDALGSDTGYVLQAYNAIAEHRTYSINFKGWDLCLPPPPRESDQSIVARQCMEHVLKYYCAVTDVQALSEDVRKLFRNAIDSFWGPSDKNIGRVELKLKSSIQAEHIYFALTKARSVHELKVELDWGATLCDIEKLRDTLAITNVGVLELYLTQQDGSTRNHLNRNPLYDPIVDIMGRQSIQSFTFRWPRDPSKHSILLSRNEDSSDLHLDISPSALNDDILGILYVITKASNLSSLAIGTGLLNSNIRHALNVCYAAGKNWTYPINFKDWGLTIPPPPRGSDESMAVHHCMEHLLDTYYKSNGQRLDANLLDELSLDAFAKATTNGSAFKTLTFGLSFQPNNSVVHNVSSIVGRSQLSAIDIWMNRDEGPMRILESIQWKHLRCLTIYLHPGTFETKVMQALVDIVTKMPFKVYLERFWFGSAKSPYTPLAPVEEDLLKTFVASRWLKELRLHVDMTLDQILSLLKSTNISRLEILVLWAKDFSPVQVDAIIDIVGHVTTMRVLGLEHAIITDEQIRRMKSKIITLKNRE